MRLGFETPSVLFCQLCIFLFSLGLFMITMISVVILGNYWYLFLWAGFGLVFLPMQIKVELFIQDKER